MLANVLTVKRLKVPTLFYIGLPLFTGKPEQQRFTVRSGVLTSTSSRRHDAISGRPLDFGLAGCS